MSQSKNDYAIVVSCNPGYGFGLISTLNAQNYFGTKADWEIAYEDFTEEQRTAISNAFPFRVNWTPINELMETVVDRRSNKREPLNRFWLAYWLLAHKVLSEGKYKAVCVIQADEFVFVNLDVYFKIAEAGILATSEYPFTFINAEDLPFGDDRGIWDRSMCGIFDGVNFVGAQYAGMVRDIIEFQSEDAFKGEASHSVIALNRSVCRHLSKEKILRLDGHLWTMDNMWGDYKLHLGSNGNRVFNDRSIQCYAWHCRWWQYGRAKAEIDARRSDGSKLDILLNNYNLSKTFMERFNSMKPEIKSENYVKGVIQ